MKKVLSVLLAAAMVAGMSVASFADVTFGSSSTDDLKAGTTKLSVEDVIWGFDRDAIVVRNGEGFWLTDETDLEPGDDLYFALLEEVNLCGKASHTHSFAKCGCGNKAHAHEKIKEYVDGCTYGCGKEAHTHVEGCFELYFYNGDIDKDWSINIKGDDFVTNASFYEGKNTAADAKKGLNVGVQYVKVELADEFDSISETATVSFELYIADKEFKNASTESVIVNALGFANDEAGSEQVSFKKTNDADKYNQWEAKEAGTATFDFDDDVYFTVKMVKNEAVVLNLSRAYNKDIDKAYNDNDGDLEFYNFKGTKDSFYRNGELFIPADEATYIYGVELDKDGEVEDIWAIEDAEWTDEYTIAGIAKEYEGWVINTDELGYYIVSSEELVLPVEEVEEPAEEPVEADKANPETGAADFVGAAVAMAVVSVAAAGALALKK